MIQKGCPYCDRKGLFISPVRYAIAYPAGAAGVPGLSGNFQIEDGPANIGEANIPFALSGQDVSTHTMKSAKGEDDQPASQYYVSLEKEFSAYNTAVGGS